MDTTSSAGDAAMDTTTPSTSTTNKIAAKRKRPHIGDGDVSDSAKASVSRVTCSGSAVRRNIKLTSVLTLRKQIEKDVHKGTYVLMYARLCASTPLMSCNSCDLVHFTQCSHTLQICARCLRSTRLLAVCRRVMHSCSTARRSTWSTRAH